MKRSAYPTWERFLGEYIATASIAEEKGRPMFRTTGRSIGTTDRITQQDAYRMIQRREAAGIRTRVGNHTVRGTDLANFLKGGSSLAKAREMVHRADTLTTQLYDRSADVSSLDEYGKVRI